MNKLHDFLKFDMIREQNVECNITFWHDIVNKSLICIYNSSIHIIETSFQNRFSVKV